MRGTIQGLSTLVLLIAFLALVAWAYGRRRRGEFEAMARMPLEEADLERESAGEPARDTHLASE